MAEPMVYIVDDDRDMRHSLVLSITVAGLAAQAFASGEAFLDAVPSRATGCVILDDRMPGLSGIEVQDRLGDLAMTLTVIFLTGYGTVRTCSTAFKAGALDFIEKPVHHELLISRVRAGLARSLEQQAQLRQRAEIRQQLGGLTRRERQVLECIRQGQSSSEIAALLGISPRTVDHHRHHMLSKTGARSVADLVRIATIERLEAGR